MDDWDNFYMLAGGTGGTLIGLIFVVIPLGIDHTQKGDELRSRLYVTPILIYFTSLLVIAMVMVPPMPDMARAVSLGVIGCAGLAYVMNLTLLSRGKGVARGEGLTEGLRLLFYVLLPLTAYALFAMSAAAWVREVDRIARFESVTVDEALTLLGRRFGPLLLWPWPCKNSSVSTVARSCGVVGDFASPPSASSARLKRLFQSGRRMV